MHEHQPTSMPRPTKFDAAVFNVKTISRSRCGGRKPCDLIDAARHNLREIHPERGAVNGIDPRRSRNNVVLQGPSTAAEVVVLADRLLAQVDGLKLKRDHVQAIECMFSVPVSFMGQEVYFKRCLSWAEQAAGLPVLSAVIHLDQNSPHMHVLMLPVKDGRHVGGSPIGRPSLHRLRGSFFDVVAGPAGFQRGSPKLHGAIKRLATEAVIAEAHKRGLPEHRDWWPTLREAIKADPLPLVVSLGIDLEALRGDATGR
ncbi:MAG: plasmid recombination protein [Burkholderiales bacterium]